MPEITINADLCKHDGLCAMTCICAVFRQERKGAIPEIDDPERCIGCGQCVAICPVGAILHSDYPEGAVTPVRPEFVPTYDQVLELLRIRRSKRLFKETPVEKDVIEKALEAARFAPSAHNEQDTGFVVVQDKKVIRKITELTAEYLGKLSRQFKNPVGRTIMRLILGKRGAAYVGELAPELEHLVSLFHNGTDWILHEPTVLILFYADSVRGAFARIDTNLAIQNATLAAETVGLGCFYAGFVTLACDRDKSIAELLSLPATHKVYGALAMGYPRLTFRNWPDRKPAKVKWI